MSHANTPLLAELPEHMATGRIAEIYDEVRRFSGVPYVSSLQRYLATLPGVLEWAWDALRPAIASGVVPETGWQLAQDVRIAPAAPVSVAKLTEWGVTARDLAEIRNVAENFVRVSPVNLVTGACLKRLLAGERPTGPGFPGPWTPPQMLAPMPGNVDPTALPDDRRAVLMRFVTIMDDKPFIPALYRQIAHWPAVLAWLANEIVPRLSAVETSTARAAFRAAAIGSAPPIVARLPPVRSDFTPDAETVRRVSATIDGYAETSPEMTMFGRLILDALPERI